MIRTDIITTIGRKYLTSNIENEELEKLVNISMLCKST